MNILFFLFAGFGTAVGVLGMVALVIGAVATAAIDGDRSGSVA